MESAATQISPCLAGQHRTRRPTPTQACGLAQASLLSCLALPCTVWAIRKKRSYASTSRLSLGPIFISGVLGPCFHPYHRRSHIERDPIMTGRGGYGEVMGRGSSPGFGWGSWRVSDRSTFNLALVLALFCFRLVSRDIWSKKRIRHTPPGMQTSRSRSRTTKDRITKARATQGQGYDRLMRLWQSSSSPTDTRSPR